MPELSTYSPATIFLESHFLPGDTAELRLPCASVIVTDRGLVVEGIETRHLQAMVWVAEYLSFDADGQHHRFRVARPHIKPPLRARFPRQ
ncbi:hypothetical protein RA280_16720 [Cupriavidus sp. CV2]|uniref:hypothetical protein n=1 Tax=Cupriavidus ulmosensis TaxID=3065913 RepID=UPI00296B39E8|nr:hypothetical protein [Cupriavidus sp. CV2]MDW3683359.1 hypothetical protein [Cupriavidus sp. CV2]